MTRVAAAVPLTERGPDFPDLRGVAPRMHRDQQESLMAVDGNQQRMRHRPGAKIFAAGLDESDGLLARREKATHRIRQRCEASHRPAYFRRDYGSRAVRAPSQDRGFPLLVHNGGAGTLRLDNSREQEILGDSYMLHALDNRPAAGRGADGRQVLGKAAQSLQEGIPASCEFLQDTGLLVRLHSLGDDSW